MILTDVAVWGSTVVVSGRLGAVVISLPVGGTQTPADSVLVGQGTSVITVDGSIRGTWWSDIV